MSFGKVLSLEKVWKFIFKIALEPYNPSLSFFAALSVNLCSLPAVLFKSFFIRQ